MRRLRRARPGAELTGTRSAGLVGIAAVTPLLADATVRAEQVSQLVLGELAELRAAEGDWLRLRAAHDGYEGWAHRGYVRELDGPTVDLWREAGWSYGAELEAGGERVCLPLRARVVLENGRMVLPDGRAARLVSGSVAARGAAIADARTMAPHDWAVRFFLGTPYQWGGVTPWGADCSGLVQTTFAARGVVVPRDAHDQAGAGAAVPLDEARAGDLLFFRSETTDRMTHVGFLAGTDALVHSTIARGGVVREAWRDGTEAWTRLRERLAAVRRIP